MTMKITAEELGTRIRFVCTSHPTQIPTVTMYGQRWAYCPGGYIAARNGHFWTAIEPTGVTEVARTPTARERVPS
jgi:hypothetical protein